jgi:hypothetical protein
MKICTHSKEEIKKAEKWAHAVLHCGQELTESTNMWYKGSTEVKLHIF